MSIKKNVVLKRLVFGLLALIFIAFTVLVIVL
jgi:hypothetical protein